MALTPKDIARMLDHSTLQPWLTEEDIRKGCEIALKYGTASVCARPCDVPILAEMLAGSEVKVCTVSGFPHGAHETAIKLAEAQLALAEGCEELDMVLNIGKLKGGDYEYVGREIRMICEAAHAAGAIVKVILETCFLTEEEKVTACHLSEQAGADFVKVGIRGMHHRGSEADARQRSRKGAGQGLWRHPGSGHGPGGPGGRRQPVRRQRDGEDHGRGGKALRGGQAVRPGIIENESRDETHVQQSIDGHELCGPGAGNHPDVEGEGHRPQILPSAGRRPPVYLL